ncbi:MAG: response regulator, partial [Bacteroidales bacterium]|nr:response regulator [Bacteroidales bacterium]
NVWLATNHGLRCYRVRDKKMEYFIKTESDNRLSHNRLVSLAYDGDLNLWAATRFKGITRIKLTGASSEPEFEKIEKNDSSLKTIQFDRNICLYYDSLQNELWSGSFDGLDRLLLNENGDVNKVLHYLPEFDNPEKIQGNQVRTIQRSENYLWLGVSDFGVYKMLPSEYHDNYGFADYTAISYTKKDGLYSNNVDNLIVDNKGRVWIGENGLSLFDPEGNGFYHFDYSDGLHGDIFKKNAFTIDMEGNYYLGGIGGISYFNPDSIKVNTQIPEIHISDIEINNKRWIPYKNKNFKSSTGSIISLTHLDLQKKQNHLKIYFSTFDYAGASRVRYKYRLLGLDSEWIITGLGENHAAYSYLKPGKYTFQVQSQQNYNANSNHITEFTIRVWRPWWSSIAMIIVYILVFISTIAFIIRLLYYNQKYKHELEIDRVSQKTQSEVSEEKLKFYTSISHELRTPLTLLIEPVSAIIKSDYKPETTKFFIDVIDKNARQLMKLVDELMDYKKIESDVIQLNTELVEIVAFTRDVMESFQVEALRQNIRLSYYPEFNKKEIPLDKDKYYKILNNLIANAISNVEIKGTVKIYLTSSTYENEQFKNHYKILSEERPLTDFIAVHVEDSGKGISKKSLQHLFDKDRHDFNYNGNKQEQNIRLDLIKSLASVHKADILISSTKNIGSCFSVHIPLDLALKHKKITSIDIGKDVKIEVSDSYKTFKNLFKIYRRDNPKILIVDDNKDIRLLLSVSLQPYYSIIEAKNGEEAYRKAVKELPDLILSDIMMPEMNGIELCQKIKNDFFTSHIPVVLISARASEEHKMEGVSTGADLYLTKPFNMEMVKAHVVSILSNRLAVQMKFKNSTKTPPLELVNTSVDESFMEKLIDIIVANISNTNYSVDLLAKDYGITRIGLFNKLKALTGQSPSEFIRSVKLNRAAELLRSNKYSSSEVSFMTGFATPSYFSKRFKEKFGVTPSEFVKDNTITFDN